MGKQMQQGEYTTNKSITHYSKYIVACQGGGVSEEDETRAVNPLVRK